MFSAPRRQYVIVRFYLAVILKMELGVSVISGKMGLGTVWLFVLDILSDLV
jgi:hypothetical protein